MDNPAKRNEDWWTTYKATQATKFQEDMELTAPPVWSNVSLLAANTETAWADLISLREGYHARASYIWHSAGAAALNKTETTYQRTSTMEFAMEDGFIAAEAGFLAKFGHIPTSWRNARECTIDPTSSASFKYIAMRQEQIRAANALGNDDDLVLHPPPLPYNKDLPPSMTNIPIEWIFKDKVEEWQVIAKEAGRTLSPAEFPKFAALFCSKNPNEKEWLLSATTQWMHEANRNRDRETLDQKVREKLEEQQKSFQRQIDELKKKQNGIQIRDVIAYCIFLHLLADKLVELTRRAFVI